MKKALITGVTGQDGSYLAEHLLGLGYEVHGAVRRVAMEDPHHRFSRIGHLLDRITLHPGNLDSYPSIFQILSREKFDECYHLASQSFVAESFIDGFSTDEHQHQRHALRPGRLPAALAEVPVLLRRLQRDVRQGGRNAAARDDPLPPPQPLRDQQGGRLRADPQLPRVLRDVLFNGILFNHESPRRGFEFVTRKITSQVARIKAGLATELRLGNLDALRDWGHAADYVCAMHLMLQQDEPDDYVVAMGESHSVREFCQLAFAEAGLDYRDYVVVDEQFFRPAEVHALLGDSSKARRVLGWTPQHTFADLVAEMVRTDLAALSLT